jgi:hypothetical protein
MDLASCGTNWGFAAGTSNASSTTAYGKNRYLPVSKSYFIRGGDPHPDRAQHFHLGGRPMLQAFEVLILDFGLFLISLGLFIKFVAWMYG